MKRIVYLMSLVLVLLPAVALAHGGGTPILTRVESGPYWLYVFTEPATPQAGSEYHVTVAVTQPQADGSETAIEDASVTVRFVPAEGDAYSQTATPSQAGPGYYETDTRLPAGGAWTVEVDVQSPLGVGAASYTLEVAAAPEGGVRWGWVSAGIVSILVGLVVFAYAFTKRGKVQAPAQQ